MHQIEYLDFPVKDSTHKIQKTCEKISDTYGDYKGQLKNGIRFRDTVVKNRTEAKNWIDENDTGWYNNLAIKYKDGRKINWLVKIEYHC